MTGALILVGTPIGNLADFSPRGIEALRSADIIACEDTRRAHKLLDHNGIPSPKMVVVNDHTETAQTDRLINEIIAGRRVVLISDAGMPAISDPGTQLVAAAAAADLPIEVVPGPSAAVTALVLSGLPAGRFCFEGFLPRKGSARAERIQAVAADRRTSIIYESPHRLARTIDDLREACESDRQVMVGRELTKKFEEVHRGTLAQAATWADGGVKGELVLVVAGSPAAQPATDDDIDDALRAALSSGLSTRDAVQAAVAATGAGKRRVYDRALAILR